MEDLAAAVTAAEKKPKPLSWQAVQQWENKKSAPTRARLKHVATVLKTPYGLFIAALEATPQGEPGFSPLLKGLHLETPSHIAQAKLGELMNTLREAGVVSAEGGDLNDVADDQRHWTVAVDDDDYSNSPEYPPGTLLEIEIGGTPVPDEPVIVKIHGELLLRIYKPRTKHLFDAVAVNPAFQPLRSEDGLSLFAVVRESFVRRVHTRRN